MAQKTKITVHPEFQIGEIDKKMFSSFLEPIGDWVYGGIWNPEHPTADELGFRQDIMELTKELGVPAVRLPGGNWTSGWEWKDSIGPKDKRKGHIDMAWRQVETNQVGHDEYFEWCKKAQTEPIYTINLGTGSIQDAIHMVEYTRFEGGTYYSDLRKENGYEKPHDIKIWCLGNEMDGPWQIASFEKDPKAYGIKAHETSKAVKWIDPSAETVVCGSSTPNNRTYPTWELDVLKECYESVDYMSLHYYHNSPEGNIAQYLSASNATEEFLNTEIAVCDLVQQIKHDPHQIKIAFDEYGTSFMPQREVTKGRAGAIDRNTPYPEFSTQMERPIRFNDPVNPPEKPRKESEMLSTLGLTSVLLMLLRHADRVKIGVMTPGLFSVGHDKNTVWKNICFYPYEMLIKNCKGISLQPSVSGPTFDADGYNLDDFNQCHAYKNLDFIETAVSLDPETGDLNIFALNRNWEEDLDAEIDLSAFEGYELKDHTQIYTEDLSAYNDAENPNRVIPELNTNTTFADGKVQANFKKLSFNMIRLTKKEA